MTKLEKISYQIEPDPNPDFNKLYVKLNNYFKSSRFKISKIYSGASIRKYYRLQFIQETYFPTSTIVLMVIPPEKSDMLGEYFLISRYLKQNGIQNPQIFEINKNEGWIFLAPASGTLLVEYLKGNLNEVYSIYFKLMDFLIELQNRTKFEKICPVFNRFFDKKKFLYEFQFHVKEQLLENYFHITFNLKEEKQFNFFFQEISDTLDTKELFFVHRDFQSSNIFYNPKNIKAPFQVIDFQDARCGSPLYDLVSILWDSYFEIPKNLQKTLIRQYYLKQNLVCNSYSVEEFNKLVRYMVIQRKLHDAGAFAYCWHSQRNNKFNQYIPAAIEMALREVQRFEQFDFISAFFDKLLKTSSPNSIDK
jgi:aminoglycoside/choline kinase family phosphotransferase